MKATILLIAFDLLLCDQAAQAMKEGVCRLTPPPSQVNRPNIFSVSQERWLGDLQADMVEPRYVLQPVEQSAYISEVGQRLVEKLPSNGIHFTFRVFESQDLRSFSLAGGHVYVSRKLLLDARSEDELAAMLAQEIGRVYVHHSASLITLRLKKMLDVSIVGDRRDLADKFQRVLNVPIPSNAELSSSDQEKDELLADRVALYLLVKAGYSPRALATFLDRINVNNGYTGSFFSIFSVQRPT